MVDMMEVQVVGPNMKELIINRHHIEALYIEHAPKEHPSYFICLSSGELWSITKESYEKVKSEL